MKAAPGKVRYIFRAEGVFALLSFPGASFIKRSFSLEVICMSATEWTWINTERYDIFVHDLFTF